LSDDLEFEAELYFHRYEEVTGDWCKLNNEELHDFKTVIKLRSRRWDITVACIAAILFRNLETRFGRRWDSNEMNLEEII